MNISVVVPVFNELENVPRLYAEITDVMQLLGRSFEILFVDDGSTDGSGQAMDVLAVHDQRLKVLHFRRNYGQTAALQAGLQWATGDVVVTLDGDLQNDPADIPLLLSKIDEGYDLVHGWRKVRQDAWLNRRLPSKIANWLISRTTRFPIHDLGCTLKAIRREIAHELELYGEMHRFIPILAFQRGARCAEVVTNHRPRVYGQTKYGISRTFRVVLDLITVKYLLDYFASPMKLFGSIGLLGAATACFAGFATLAMKFLSGVDMTGNPLLMLTVLASLASLQFFSLGLLGEVNARIYYSAQPKQNYAIRSTVNVDPKPDRATIRSRAA